MKIAREAWTLSGVLVAGTMLTAWLLHPLAALAPLSFLLFTLWFFRDPERRPPDDPAALVSPADGKIIKAGPGGVSIFMNVFNVHVCRAPGAGTVESVQHFPGRFLSAFKDAASEHNERTVLVLADGSHRLRFTLVAGLVARRIVCHVRTGQRLAAGDRVGLIQFGSRVDVEIPDGAEVNVRLGQRVVAGETRLATMASRAEVSGNPPARETVNPV